MSRLLILVVIVFNHTFLCAQDPNKNIFSQDDIIKLSNYAIKLENSILANNPNDSVKIAKLKGEYEETENNSLFKRILNLSILGTSVIFIIGYTRDFKMLDGLNKRANSRYRLGHNIWLSLRC